MRRLLEGVDIVVIRRMPTGNTDAMGEPAIKERREIVHDVLWAPRSSDDMDDPQRPHGDVDDIKLHFPKAYTASLAGCDIEVDGSRYRVQGDPEGFPPHLTPGRWNRPVIGRRVQG